jgi:hypothetical protein
LFICGFYISIPLLFYIGLKLPFVCLLFAVILAFLGKAGEENSFGGSYNKSLLTLWPGISDLKGASVLFL